jgi:UDP-N-acetylglucosamine--N-acetylmuramyl-(pentapeptide) pyrophosphoryl-undecaprenol N-acetylglucosamine transferase
MRAVVGTGGTAGHVFPALAMAARLRDRLGAEVVFVGRAEGQEAALVRAAGFPLETVEALPFRRRLSVTTLRAPLAAIRAAGRCRAVVRGADVVIGMGGYVSVPVSVAAWRERVPLVLHEQNAAPGLANRVAARWARTVALSFGAAAARLPRRVSTVVTGNPVRDRILRVRDERQALAARAADELGLEAGRRTVVIFGGSQGALRLNRAAVELCGILGDRDDLQLLVITGPRHHEEIRRLLPPSRGLLVRTAAFVERMDLAYATANLAISRAGATTVAELTVCGVPAILVPYPYATGRHQEANARAVERAGGATVLLDDEATGPALTAGIRRLLGDASALSAMGRASLRFGRPDAADALADVALEAGRAERRS